MVISAVLHVGDAKDIQEAVTGKDLITGKKLTGGDRALTITAAVLPVVSGPMLKGAAKGGKIAVKEAPGAIKKAGTVIKKNAPEVKKAVKNSDVAKDTAKVLKEKTIKKAKDAEKTKKTEQFFGNKEVLDVKKAENADKIVNNSSNSFEKKTPAQRAANNGYPGFVTSPNGGPDFRGTNYIYKNTNGNEVVVSIKMTGNRQKDFNLANEAAGFTDYKWGKSAIYGYTWHYFGDYDPVKGTCTMQLVKTPAHQKTVPHTGSCAQYDAVHGSIYNKK